MALAGHSLPVTPAQLPDMRVKPSVIYPNELVEFLRWGPRHHRAQISHSCWPSPSSSAIESVSVMTYFLFLPLSLEWFVVQTQLTGTWGQTRSSWELTFSGPQDQVSCHSQAGKMWAAGKQARIVPSINDQA